MDALSGALSSAAGGLVDKIELSMANRVEIQPGSTLSGHEIRALVDKLGRFTAADLHATQPNLRAVVDFRARNVAQLGLHVYKPVDKGRERDRTSVAALVMDDPNPAQTGYQLIYSLVADMDLYDEAFWVIAKGNNGWAIRPLPVADVIKREGSEWHGTFAVTVNQGGKPVRVPAENLIHFRGYSPTYGSRGSSPVTALRDTLTEQVAAQKYRLSVWNNGGLISSYITRPKDAGDWSKEARSRFRDRMRDFRSGGVESGGMPVLEDGMKIEAGALNSKEQQYVEAAQLSLATVARTYHVNPAMLGETGGVTYANMREFRKSLYGETLGPLLRMIEDYLNTRLLPILGITDGTYYEFNVKEKLRGSFEEEAEVLSKAIGGAGYMSPNEARATQNLPPVEGGENVFQPLNMAVLGGEEKGADPETLGKRITAAKQLIQAGFAPAASLAAVGLDPVEHLGLLPVTVQKPVDPETGEVDEDLVDEVAGDKAGATEAKAATVTVKGESDEGQRDRIHDLIQSFSRRQQAAVLAALNSKAAPDWWDQARWDRELATDLTTLAKVITAQVGAKTAAQLGHEGDYDLQATVAFLEAVAQTRAHMLNEGTRAQLEAVLDGTAPEGKDAGDVFTQLRESRGQLWGTSIAAALVGFAAVEAGRQVARAGRKTTKTWVVRSNNPRDTHAAMNGETVGIGERFSNGSDWPGDSKALPPSEVANCKCGVEMTTEE